MVLPRLTTITRGFTAEALTIAAILTFMGAAAAAGPQSMAGIWTGTLQAFYCPGINCGPVNLRLFLHVTTDSAGKLRASFDSLDQGAMGLRADQVVLKGNTFSFEIPSVKGNYHGTISADGKSLNGTWSQGILFPLVFERISVPPGVAGIWTGPLTGCPLRMVLHVTANSADKIRVSLHSTLHLKRH
jgi:hypothetical protein